MPQTLWQGFDETYAALLEEYPIDPSRVYMTGISMGGTGIWEFMRWYKDKLACAAAVPVCGTAWAYYHEPKEYNKAVRSYPIWAFHGELDDVVLPVLIKRTVTGVNASNPQYPVKFTLFPELHHDCWENVYTSQLNKTTNPEYDPFDTDIYLWMLNYRRGVDK